MKRRRGIIDQNKNNQTDGQKTNMYAMSAGGNKLDEPPCTLNTVFEVLLPLEPKISGIQPFDCNNIGEESVVASMMVGKAQFNFCQKCGCLEDHCKCAGSGDFEKIPFHKEFTKGKMVRRKIGNTGPIDGSRETECELNTQSLEQSEEVKYKEEINSEANSMGNTQSLMSRVELNENMQIDCEKKISNTSVATNTSKDENYIVAEKTTSAEIICPPITENSSKLNIDVECNFTSNSKGTTTLSRNYQILTSHIEKKCEKFDIDSGKTDLSPLSPTSEYTTIGSQIQAIYKTTHKMIMGELTPIGEDKHEKMSDRLPTEDGDNLGCDGLQIFEHMDEDDIHLGMSLKPDFHLLEELKEAYKKSKRTAHLINQIKDSIKKFQSKDNLSEEDTLVIKIKQVELAKKLTEFEEITQRMQNLMGIAELNNIEHSVTIPKIEDKTEISTSVSSKTVNEDMQMSQQCVDQSKENKSLKPTENENNFISVENRDNSNMPEEIEVLETKQSFPSITEHEDKLSYFEKDNEVTNFLMMDKIIPKVIVCGSQDSMPRVIVCEKPNSQPATSTPYTQSPFCPEYVPPFTFKETSLFEKKTEVPEMMISLSGRLSESYNLQEKLATENAALEDGRYLLQEELLKRDNIVDALQKKVGCLQSEVRIIVKENLALQEKLEEFNNMDCSCNRKTLTGRSMPTCCGPNPDTSTTLERQLNMMEGEVRTMQNELQQVQKERQQLEQQRKLLKPSPNGQSGQKKIPCVPQTCTCGPNGRGENPEQMLRELQEKYARLEDDFKNKVAEVSALRHELEKWKCKCHSAEEGQESAEAECRCMQAQLRAAEQDTKRLSDTKENLLETDQQLSMANQRFREAQDELEELRSLIQDQTTQLEDYRNKYLQAQQQVEEQRRQIDVMEIENNRIGDQVNLEIQRVKTQFQEKLEELTPLPDILKATQLKLQDCQQARMIAEHNAEELSKELANRQAELAALKKEIEDSDLNKAAFNGDCLEKLNNLEAKCNELRDENSRLRSELIRLDEIAAQAQRRLEEKSHDAAQLAAQLDTVREESARQVARTKERAETMRRSLQCQISELERQLAQSRALARAAQKDKDEIRQRMQCQINNLNEGFEQAQMRIRSLQSHVNFLKSSYSNIFEPNANAIECACPNFAQEYNY